MADYASLASKIFMDAAGYIRTYGWQVTGMGEHGKPRCSMGALASAYPKQKWEKGLAELMYHSLNRELGGINLTDFNYKYNSGTKVASLFERIATSINRR